jgi:hypothetical protein
MLGAEVRTTFFPHPTEERVAPMKRILSLVMVALMLAAAMALSGVAQARPLADPADAKCFALAMRTLSPGFIPADYTFISGTEGIDDFTGQATDGADVFCGFGGNDRIDTLDAGDIFLGGSGNDQVQYENNGTFYGGAGYDYVYQNWGFFYGEEGYDVVYDNYGIFVQ